MTIMQHLRRARTDRERFRIARIIRYLAKRRRRERERFQRLFYSNGEAWVCSSSPCAS